MSSNLLSGYAGAAVNQQQLLAAGMIVFRPWTNCPWIVRSGDNLSVETTMETTTRWATTFKDFIKSIFFNRKWIPWLKSYPDTKF